MPTAGCPDGDPQRERTSSCTRLACERAPNQRMSTDEALAARRPPPKRLLPESLWMEDSDHSGARGQYASPESSAPGAWLPMAGTMVVLICARSPSRVAQHSLRQAGS